MSDILKFPSSDKSSYDFLMFTPQGMALEDAVAIANRVIVDVNYEDEQNDGEMNDGTSVEENIQRRLIEAGFVATGKIINTLAWDEYHGEPEPVETAPAKPGVTPA